MRNVLPPNHVPDTTPHAVLYAHLAPALFHGGIEGLDAQDLADLAVALAYIEGAAVVGTLGEPYFGMPHALGPKGLVITYLLSE